MLAEKSYPQSNWDLQFQMMTLVKTLRGFSKISSRRPIFDCIYLKYSSETIFTSSVSRRLHYQATATSSPETEIVEKFNCVEFLPEKETPSLVKEEEPESGHCIGKSMLTICTLLTVSFK